MMSTCPPKCFLSCVPPALCLEAAGSCEGAFRPSWTCRKWHLQDLEHIFGPLVSCLVGTKDKQEPREGCQDVSHQQGLWRDQFLWDVCSAAPWNGAGVAEPFLLSQWQSTALGRGDGKGSRPVILSPGCIFSLRGCVGLCQSSAELSLPLPSVPPFPVNLQLQGSFPAVLLVLTLLHSGSAKATSHLNIFY